MGVNRLRFAVSLLIILLVLPLGSAIGVVVEWVSWGSWVLLLLLAQLFAAVVIACRCRYAVGGERAGRLGGDRGGGGRGRAPMAWTALQEGSTGM